VNGHARSSWLYTNEIFLVAELDSTGAVRNRYAYGTNEHVPDLMVQGGITYRIITDQLGSVRAVVDANTGAIAQRIDYDPWGVITTDTAPDFQSLGFAGGIQDRRTGLTRFGARDYEPGIGRWTSKDPIGFEGGSFSLMAYNDSDPISGSDPSGLEGTGAYRDGLPPGWSGLMEDPDFWECLEEVLGIKDILLVLGPAGLPLIPKPYSMGGSGYTSPLSAGLQKALGKTRWPSGRVWAPTYKTPRAMSNKAARVLGRWAPFVGWALTAWDIYKIEECYQKKKAGKCKG
jgi:RHS repeat-associated protein